MIETRRVAVDVRYNGVPFCVAFGSDFGSIITAYMAENGLTPATLAGNASGLLKLLAARAEAMRRGTAVGGSQIGAEVESMSYTDTAAANSDSLDITINAQDGKWAGSWMPDKGAKLQPKILGRNWEREGDSRTLQCGLFILDDLSFQDAPTTLQVGGVSKPSNTDFSELERETVWKNTSVAMIGATIAARYGLMFTYDAEDYAIECDEQDGTDSSYYNTLCSNYGLILKVYAMRLWVYDRERYKAKRAVKTFTRSMIRRGSFSWSTTLSGTYTGGTFTYTDADKDIDIVCSVGGGSHTKNLSRRATSVYDASVQLCAELNNANHGNTKIKFSTDGEWQVSAANCIEIAGFGSRIDGKYFVDKVQHKVSRSGGFASDLECSLVEKPFYHWEVGGHIECHAQDDSSDEEYNSNYETTSPAANAASTAEGAIAGQAVTLNYVPFYHDSTTENPSSFRSGTFYYYDGILVNGRYRMAISPERCNKLPMSANVTDWVRASDCQSGGTGTYDNTEDTGAGGGSGGSWSGGSGGTNVDMEM